MQRLKSIFLFLVITTLGLPLFAQDSQKDLAIRDTIMVMPFQNSSDRADKADFNWVGESFAEALTELLSGQWQVSSNRDDLQMRDDLFGFRVVSNESRKTAQVASGIPLSVVPSIATSLRLAMQKRVTKLIIGNFKIYGTDVEGKEVPTIVANTRIIDVAGASYDYEKDRRGSPLLNKDGRLQFKEIVVTRPLSDLQSIHGEIAYHILLRQNVITTSLNSLTTVSNKIPNRAFEAYIKGLLTRSPEVRQNYFVNAIRLYREDSRVGLYADAALELAHNYIKQGKPTEAVQYFKDIINDYGSCRDAQSGDQRERSCNVRVFAEASFFLGLQYYQMGDFEQALAVLSPLADDVKLIALYNTLGSINVHASRIETKNQSKAAAQLIAGKDFLKRAVESNPVDGSIHFNFGISLLLSGESQKAADEFRSAIVANAKDGEAYFLLAKALEKLNDPLAIGVDSKARELLATNNRYAKLEDEWRRSKTFTGIALRVSQPAREQFSATILSAPKKTVSSEPIDEGEALMQRLRDLVKNGRDDEALSLSRVILARYGSTAETYVLIGKVQLRNGEKEQAVSSFKSAAFYDPSSVDAYAGLVKIFVEKGDCLQAKNYSGAAAAAFAELDRSKLTPASINALQDTVMSLQRLSERCSK